MINESCIDKTCDQCWDNYLATEHKVPESTQYEREHSLFYVRPPKPCGLVLKVLTPEMCYKSIYCVEGGSDNGK